MPKKNPLLEKAHRQLLTPLVLKRLDFLKNRAPKGAHAFDANVKRHIIEKWMKNKRVEFLPDGTPYKVSSDGLIRHMGGMFVSGVNKPLILVSDLLDKAERKDTARHEFNEWRLGKSSSEDYSEAHKTSLKRMNPKLRKSALKKSARFENRA